MSQRIRKEIVRLYQCLMSMTAVCLCSVRKTLAHVDYNKMVSGIACVRIDGGFNNARWSLRRDPSCGALTVFTHALSPHARLIEPPLLGDNPAYQMKKEHVMDSDAASSGKGSSLPHLKRIAEEFHKKGLDVPRRTINLARDDLESIYSYPCLL